MASDANIRCMPIRRTTLAAEADDLATIEDEARRRGTSLARVLREMVARGANEIREARKPRFGVARSEKGAAIAASSDEHAPARRRRRS